MSDARWWRHLASVLLLPANVTITLPVLAGWITTAPAGGGGWLLPAAGGVLMALGLAGLVATVRSFATEGGGTLAPWDPPGRLVVRGLYRHVRNPMITSVALLLLGEAALWRSRPLLGWAGGFILINAIYIPLVEEPALERRFGEAYRAYCRSVPRLLPRLRAAAA